MTTTSLAKRLATTFTMALTLTAPLTLTATPAHAYSGGGTWSEKVNCVRISPAACAHAKDAMDWARNVTAWRFPHHKNAHNNIADAFRHCIWTGAMSQRLGVSAADSISTKHENVESGQPANERRMDLNNNTIGIGVGRNAAAQGGDTWGTVWRTCERHAYNRALFGLNGRGSY